MQLPQVDYYAIQDINDSAGAKKSLQVIAEYDNEREARQAKSGLRFRNCEVYADVDGRTWRVICQSELVKSHPRE